MSGHETATDLTNEEEKQTSETRDDPHPREKEKEAIGPPGAPPEKQAPRHSDK